MHESRAEWKDDKVSCLGNKRNTWKKHSAFWKGTSLPFPITDAEKPYYCVNFFSKCYSKKKMWEETCDLSNSNSRHQNQIKLCTHGLRTYLH